MPSCNHFKTIGVFPVVPISWCIIKVRRDRLRKAEALQIGENLQALPIRPDLDAGDHTLVDTLALALRLDITAYDAAYLELAHRHELPLATLDRKLRKACTKLKIPLLPENL